MSLKSNSSVAAAERVCLHPVPAPQIRSHDFGAIYICMYVYVINTMYVCMYVNKM